jgi:predicted nucleic acid-binding protein
MAGVVFDANVVIALVDSDHIHHEAAKRIYLENAGEDLYLSSLTYAEILVAPVLAKRLKSFSANLASAGFEVIGISADFSIELAKCRAETSLKMPDSCVLALAQSLGATVATADRKLAITARSAKIGVLVLE